MVYDTVVMPLLQARPRRFALAALLLVLSIPAVQAGSIDTAFLEAPWPKQRVHEYEVDKYMIRWRQKASDEEGIFAGASFVAPSPIERTWTLATDYSDLGTKTPGVEAVRYLENTPERQVIQIDVKVLWKMLTLTFEIERQAPEAVRFRLLNDWIGEYRGMCLMRPRDGQTEVEVATWLQPLVRVPKRLILYAERVILLKGIRNFLESCEPLEIAKAISGT